MVADSSQLRDGAVTLRPLDQVSLFDWSDAVRYCFCSFEYRDIVGGYWSVKPSPTCEGKPLYTVYNHQIPGRPTSTSDIQEVVQLITSYSPVCSPAHIWGSIGALPWRAVELSSVSSVIQAAAEDRVTGQFGEVLPSA